jgi:hypothetical protein
VTWFKVDDGFMTNPKVLSIPRAQRLECLGLWVSSGAWCARHLTDGRVPAYMLEELGANLSHGDMLADSGLWVRDGDDYRFNDWEEYQPMKRDVVATRESERRRKEAYRARKGGTKGESPEPVPMGPDRSATVVDNTPTRPDPTRPVKEKRVVQSGYPKAFEEWWLLYPRKESKGAALRAWEKARKLVDPDTLAKATQAYTLMCLGKEKQFVKLPAGWLNDRKWEDDYSTSRSGPPPAPALGAEGAMCADHLGYPLPCLRCEERPY